jgi:hypothetical protein
MAQPLLHLCKSSPELFFCYLIKSEGFLSDCNQTIEFRQVVDYNTKNQKSDLCCIVYQSIFTLLDVMENLIVQFMLLKNLTKL